MGLKELIRGRSSDRAKKPGIVTASTPTVAEVASVSVAEGEDRKLTLNPPINGIDQGAVRPLPGSKENGGSSTTATVTVATSATDERSITARRRISQQVNLPHPKIMMPRPSGSLQLGGKCLG
jgi:hypothetical protein